MLTRISSGLLPLELYTLLKVSRILFSLIDPVGLLIKNSFGLEFVKPVVNTLASMVFENTCVFSYSATQTSSWKERLLFPEFKVLILSIIEILSRKAIASGSSRVWASNKKGNRTRVLEKEIFILAVVVDYYFKSRKLLRI